MSYFRVNDKCNCCLSCVENCPASALDFIDQDGRRTLKHNMTKCARCGQCWRICPQEAIEFQHLLVGQWDDVVTLDLILLPGVRKTALFNLVRTKFGQHIEFND